MNPLSLPDEIVDQILDYALTIPDETFRAWRTPQTYAGTPLSQPHNILATSWQWYRVGKPYLYEAAILRKPEQVHRFCEAICKYHPSGKLARFLRRVRVDGGYSPELGKILRTTGPQITELYLCFDVSFDDRIKGLLKALKQVNPHRLFLDASPTMKQDAPLERLNALYDVVSVSASGWFNLRRVDVGPGYTLPDELIEYLFQLPQVEYASSSIKASSDEFTPEWIDDVLRPILERPALTTLQIRNGKEWLSQGLSTWGAELYRVREKLYLGEDKDMLSLAAFPEQDVIIPEPTSLPELPDRIWARILWMATHYDGYDPAVDDYAANVRAYDEDPMALDTRLHVLLVCKKFHRIGQVHLYSHPFLSSNPNPFLAHIEKRPDLAALVQVLHVDPQYMHNSKPGSEVLYRQFSPPLVNLVSVNSGTQVFPEFLKHISDGSVLPLVLLKQRIAPPDMRRQRLTPTDMITPSMFLKVPHLRCVVLTGGRAGRLDEAPHVDLPQLECLHLREPGIGLTKLFRIMSLPSLREFGFRATSQAAVPVLDFLKVHGAKLGVLKISVSGTDDYKQPIFDYCPNITELRLETRSLPPASVPFLLKSKPHARIERITLFGVSLARRYYPEGENAEAQTLFRRWERFLDFLSQHREKLPAFVELLVPGRFDWPVNKSQYYEPFSWIATPIALMLHVSGVALADKTGARYCRFDYSRTHTHLSPDTTSRSSPEADVV